MGGSVVRVLPAAARLATAPLDVPPDDACDAVLSRKLRSRAGVLVMVQGQHDSLLSSFLMIEI
jgi:hypothetical protein